MEKNIKKCTSKEDENIDAISYCGECKIYMCNKCEKFHFKLFSTHQTYNLDKQNDDIFTGYCNESNHREKLNYFCKNHNILCCSTCLCKLQKDGIGLHKDCEVCFIEDIKKEKEEKIKLNRNYLEDLSKSLQDSIDNLKILYEKITKNKEELKLEIQKVFTKIRNELNNREDKLLLEVDEKFNDIYCDESILSQCEKLPKRVKLSLEKGKNIELKEGKLASFINECINIENNIKDINIINENINKYKKGKDMEIKFDYNEQLNLIFEIINEFGIILVNDIYVIDSTIINKDKEKHDIIIKWLKQKTNKNIIKFEKIFIMSINGDSSKDFHKYCDNKGATLTLIKTTKNKIFGGFTPFNWESKTGNKCDKSDQTFIFSLNLMKKYDLINKEKNAIYFRENIGPAFGGTDLQIDSNMKKGKTYSNEYTNFLSNNNLELTGGKGTNESFDVEELEIFKVIY